MEANTLTGRPRGLSPAFLNDLKLDSGFLAPLLELVKGDRSLCLELRDDYLNIYYRGGNLLRLRRTAAGYHPWFDADYFRAGPCPTSELPTTLLRPEDLTLWLDSLPLLKNAMDRSPKHAVEREMQQLLVADNNRWGQARSTDYYVCDIEYASPYGRFDLVAVHWPSSPTARKQQTERRLVVAEVKYGDNALDGAAGLHAHVRDMNACLGDPAKLAALKAEMLVVFNQKRALGLIVCDKDLLAFSDQKPLLLLVLANHDPDTSGLAKLLGSLPPSPNADLRIASASLMGYGLFDPALLTVEEALSRLAVGR